MTWRDESYYERNGYTSSSSSSSSSSSITWAALNVFRDPLMQEAEASQTVAILLKAIKAKNVDVIRVLVRLGGARFVGEYLAYLENLIPESLETPGEKKVFRSYLAEQSSCFPSDIIRFGEAAALNLSENILDRLRAVDARIDYFRSSLSEGTSAQKKEYMSDAIKTWALIQDPNHLKPVDNFFMAEYFFSRGNPTNQLKGLRHLYAAATHKNASDPYVNRAKEFLLMRLDPEMSVFLSTKSEAKKETSLVGTQQPIDSPKGAVGGLDEDEGLVLGDAKSTTEEASGLETLFLARVAELTKEVAEEVKAILAGKAFLDEQAGLTEQLKKAGEAWQAEHTRFTQLAREAEQARQSALALINQLPLLLQTKVSEGIKKQVEHPGDFSNLMKTIDAQYREIVPMISQKKGDSKAVQANVLAKMGTELVSLTTALQELQSIGILSLQNHYAEKLTNSFENGMLPTDKYRVRLDELRMILMHMASSLSHLLKVNKTILNDAMSAFDIGVTAVFKGMKHVHANLDVYDNGVVLVKSLKAAISTVDKIIQSTHLTIETISNDRAFLLSQLPIQDRAGVLPLFPVREEKEAAFGAASGSTRDVGLALDSGDEDDEGVIYNPNLEESTPVSQAIEINPAQVPGTMFAAPSDQGSSTNQPLAAMPQPLTTTSGQQASGTPEEGAKVKGAGPMAS